MTESEVLQNVSMEFPKTGMTAIVGESGCGKSTAVSLLLGVYSPEKGRVTAGGRPLMDMSRDAYYAHLSLVSYNTYLFHTTVRENFTLVNPKISEEEIYEALEKVNLLDLIRDRGGLDWIIEEDGANLSGGQKQRLALAVNLAADQEIYIFDEATSNIDVESEAIIMRNIRALADSRNVIVISHRLENVVDADNIYYMESGCLKESGTHRELMEKQGGYARLYTAQKNLEKGYEEAEA